MSEHTSQVKHNVLQRLRQKEFTTRTYNCLWKKRIFTWADLALSTKEELMEIRNFGRKCLLEVRIGLTKRGLTLAGESLEDNKVELAEHLD